MNPLAAPRWAISFADLGLILLGCFVMLHAMSGGPAGRSEAPAIPSRPAEEFAAADLFEPGDARLRPEARARLQALGARASGRKLVVTSRGADEASARLDAFELAAARAAAVAREFGQSGVAERDIVVRMESRASEQPGQMIAVRFTG